MKRTTLYWILFFATLILLSWAVQSARSQTYDGAEGYGAIANGGRVEGTKEVHVTRMDDPKFERTPWTQWKHLVPGTLRWAMHQRGPKKIIFDQPGTIRLWCPLQITTIYNGPISAHDRVNNMTFNETRQPITIIGSININGMAGADTVWLNTRFRAALWNNGWRPFQGGPQATGDPFILIGAGNCLVDHCEFSGGADETFNYISGVGKLTLQWSVVCEAFKQGDFGMKWGDDYSHNYGTIVTFGADREDTGVTIAHCLFANLQKRIPYALTSVPANPPAKHAEIVNTVCYNWGTHSGSTQSRDYAVLVGNTWRYGPNAGYGTRTAAVGYMSPSYHRDNVVDYYGKLEALATAPATIHGFRGFSSLGATPPEPLHEFPVTVTERVKSIEDVLNKAGVFPLDNVSAANRQAYRDGTGWQGAHPDYKAGTLDEYLSWATATADGQPPPIPDPDPVPDPDPLPEPDPEP